MLQLLIGGEPVDKDVHNCICAREIIDSSYNTCYTRTHLAHSFMLCRRYEAGIANWPNLRLKVSLCKIRSYEADFCFKSCMASKYDSRVSIILLPFFLYFTGIKARRRFASLSQSLPEALCFLPLIASWCK